MKAYDFIKYGAIIGAILLFLGLGFNLIDLATELTLFILFLTFLAILWYSMETRELKEISEKRPCISFNRYGEKIILKNYGDSIARNIIILDEKNILHEIPLISRAEGGYAPLPLNIIMEPEKFLLLKDCQNNISICYTDQSGRRKYITKIRWNDSKSKSDGCEIIDHSWK